MRVCTMFLAILALTTIPQVRAQTLIDAWYYTGVADGIALDGGPGTGSISFDDPSTAWRSTWSQSGNVNIVSNQAQRWEGSYVAGTVSTNDSAFRNLAPTVDPIPFAGVYEWSYDIVSADFANTAANDGSANLMYIVRGQSGTSSYDCGLRLRYEGGLDVTNVFTVGGTPISTNVYPDADQIQVLMNSADLGGWMVLTNFAGSSISNLNLRMVYDLNMQTNAAYLTQGGGNEIFLYGGTMQADWKIAELRQGFQSGNGNNSWRPGDFVVIDNIELTELEPPPLPETGIMDFWTFDGLTNGSPLSAALSSGIVGGAFFSNIDTASITNDTLQLTPSTSPSLFRTEDPSLFKGATSGVFEIAYELPYMNFSNTLAAGTTANFGFEIRDRSVGTPIPTVGLTVRFDGPQDRFELQLRDDAGTTEVASFPGAVFSNLGVRLVFDLGDAGNPGSLFCFYTSDGVEVAVTYAGTVPSGFHLDEYRLRAQFANGGNVWQPGDVAYLDNLRIEKLAAMPPLPVYLDKVVYEMNDASGTLLNALAQTGTDGGQFAGTDPNITANGLGSLVFTGDGTNDVTRSHLLDVAYTSGLHRLEFAFDDWNLDASEDSSLLKFGLVDATGTNNVQFGIDVNTNNATVRFRAAANNGGDAGQDFYDHAGYVASTGVVLRIDVNLDAGIYGASWRYDNATEFTDVVVGGSLGALAGVAQIRLLVNGGDNAGFDGSDYIHIDSLRYSTTSAETVATPQDLYVLWLQEYPGLGVSTNLYDDSDGDTYVNLWEYAFNGDPTVNEPIAFAPAFDALLEQDGTNYIDYVYVRWAQPADRGLSYEIQFSTDLASGTWTNDTSKYEVLLGGPVGVDFWAVTNRIDATDDVTLSIRTEVNVTFDP